MKKQRNIAIPRNWTFKDDSVADGFDAHVNEQLPWYSLATDAIKHITCHYLPERGLMYDIGASTGNIGRAVNDLLKARCADFIAIEESEQMAKRYTGPEKLIVGKAEEYTYEPFDVATLFLVLMFIPVAVRSALVRQLRRRLKPGGAIIIFDKIHQPAGYEGAVMRRLTMAWKLNNGADPEDIIAKELSLAGVQRPIEPKILGHDARLFFQFGEFAGWVIHKGEAH